MRKTKMFKIDQMEPNKFSFLIFVLKIRRIGATK